MQNQRHVVRRRPSGTCTTNPWCKAILYKYSHLAHADVSIRQGSERVKGLYAFRSIIDHGARITLGSDFPVEDMNPLAGFYAAITRVSPDGTSPHGPGGWCVHRSPALLLFGHADSPS